MRIKYTNNTSLDHYSVESVSVQSRVGERISPTQFPVAKPQICVVLKREYSNRTYGLGSAYEIRKQGAEYLLIDCDELQAMLAPLNAELELCHSLLVQHDLLGELNTLRRKVKEDLGT